VSSVLEEAPDIVPAGDAALLATFADRIELAVNARVRAVAAAVQASQAPGVIEVTIAYAALLVHYDPMTTSYEAVRDIVLGLARAAHADVSVAPRLREIPTVYGGPYGIDLPDVASQKGMSEDEVIALHSGATYTVFMLGFSPGNPYLGGLPPELAMPRLDRPREIVPEGTVAIANQAVVYSVTSPGGWRWLGRTAVKMFTPGQDPPTFLEAGDRVRFVPISEEEYLRMGGERAE
jgi:inhibitor of KinA